MDITIPYLTPTFNQMLRMHFRRRAKVLSHLAWTIRGLAGPSPAQPYERARVTIHRNSTGTLDDDGLKTIAKGILDVLQPVSKKHPLGLGWIAGDDPKHLELVVIPVKSSASTTRLVVEQLE